MYACMYVCMYVYIDTYICIFVYICILNIIFTPACWAWLLLVETLDIIEVPPLGVLCKHTGTQAHRHELYIIYTAPCWACRPHIPPFTQTHIHINAHTHRHTYTLIMHNINTPPCWACLAHTDTQTHAHTHINDIFYIYRHAGGALLMLRAVRFLYS